MRTYKLPGTPLPVIGTSPLPSTRILVPSSTPAGMRTSSVRRPRTLPTPSQSEHESAGLMLVPLPPHAGHVEAIWNPFWMTKVLVPVPLHTPQVDFRAPFFIPAPSQVPHRSTGVVVTLRVVPRQASSNEMLTTVSISSPLSTPPANPAPPNPAGPRPAPALPPKAPNRESKIVDASPDEKPPNPPPEEKPPKPPAPPKGDAPPPPPPNGLKPGEEPSVLPY